MKKNKVVAVIPARMASSRFPGKPLADIMGLPMVEHVRRRSSLSSALDEVYVATCDEEIKDTVRRYGGKVIMTAKTHQRCTDRVEEASREIDADLVVIIQGDEPLIDPCIFEELIRPLVRGDGVECSNLLSIIRDKRDLLDRDIIKAVLDVRGYIMYYSRSQIPYFRVEGDCQLYRQTGISAFTKKFLHLFSRLPPTPKEVVESIDFLRILEHGYDIYGVGYSGKMIGVDRADDIYEIERVLSDNPVQKELHQRILDAPRCA